MRISFTINLLRKLVLHLKSMSSLPCTPTPSDAVWPKYQWKAVVSVLLT